MAATGTDTYQKRLYMDRTEPTKGWKTYMTIVAGFLLFAFGAAFCEETLTSTEGMVDKIFVGFIGLIFIFIGLSLIVGAVKSRRAMNEFEKTTTSTGATVLDRYIEENSGVPGYGGDSTIYYVVVRFDAVEKPYFINAMVNKRLYEKADRGKILNVTYANSNPCILLFEGEY
jgi:hypothetical protein